jgi:hypothetical protein
MEPNQKITIKRVFDRVVFELDNNINSDFNEYHRVYNLIHEGHNDSLEVIKRSFYEMAFAIEVRKTKDFEGMEREEINGLFIEFQKSIR